MTGEESDNWIAQAHARIAEGAASEGQVDCTHLRQWMPMSAEVDLQSLQRIETFRANKYDPDNPMREAWSCQHVGGILTRALTGDASALKTSVAMKNGKPMTIQNFTSDINSFRSGLRKMADHPFFAHLKPDTAGDLAFIEAQDSAQWGIEREGQPVRHDASTKAVADVVLADGADTFGHLLNMLDHIERVRRDEPDLHKRDHHQIQTAFMIAFEGLAYSVRGEARSDLTIDEVWSGQGDLITAIYAVVQSHFGYEDVDVGEAKPLSLGGRPKAGWLSQEKIGRDFANVKKQTP